MQTLISDKRIEGKGKFQGQLDKQRGKITIGGGGSGGGGYI